LEELYGEKAQDATDNFADVLARSGPVIEAVALKYGEKTANKVAKGLADGSITIQQAVNDYHLIIEGYTPKLEVDTSGAITDINSLMNKINGMPSSYVVPTPKPRPTHSPPSRAGGGILPGAPSKKDNMFIHAASGEYVVNAAATAKNLPLLDAINFGGAYAQGGLIKGHSLSYWNDKQASALELTNMRIDIRDHKKDLAARVKEGKRKGQYELRGLDRRRAIQELHIAEQALEDAKFANRLDDSKKGSIEHRMAVQEKAADRKKQQAADKAQKAQYIQEQGNDLTRSIRRGELKSSIKSSFDSADSSNALNVVDQMFDLARSGNLSAKKRKNLSSAASQAEKDLNDQYKALDKINKQLDKANEKVSELQDIKDSVASGLKSQFSLSDLFTDVEKTTKQIYKVNAQGVGYFTTETTTTGGAPTSGGMIAAAKAKADKIESLSGKLDKLAAMGLSGSILQEIASMPLDQAIDTADALLKGGQTDVNGLNEQYARIDKWANQAGQNVTEGFYDGGLKAAEGFAQGLEDQKATIEDTIMDIAMAMQDALKKALGIHSPSRVFRMLMRFVGKGSVLGLQDSSREVNRAAADLLNPNNLFGNVSPVVSGQTGGPVAGKTIHQNITVNTQEIDPRVHSAQLGWELAARTE
jgi:hypothetical protein